MLRSLIYAVLIVLGLIVYSYWEPLYYNYLRPADTGAQTEYRIGLVYPMAGGETDLVYGAEIAAEAANSHGGLIGRRVEIVRVPETRLQESDRTRAIVDQALPIARRLSRDPNLIGVIGHSASGAAVAASPIYGQARKLYFASYGTNVSLVQHKLDTVFTMAPNDAALSYVLASYAAKQGYKRLVLLSDDTEYGQETSWFFAVYAEQLGLHVVYRNAFRPGRRSIENILAFMLDNTTFSMASVNAVVVISEAHETGRFIAAARRLGIASPILGTGNVSDPDVLKIAGDAMRDVVGATVVDSERATPVGVAFAKAFHARYGRSSSSWGVLGHDAVLLTVEAARRTGGVDAVAMSDLLRLMRFANPIVGANGAYGFSPRGEVIGQPVFVIRHNGKQFEYVDRYDTLPRVSDYEYLPMARSRSTAPTPSPGGQ